MGFLLSDMQHHQELDVTTPSTAQATAPKTHPKGAALFDLTGRIALVTGSTQGIGFALARGLAEQGAHVILNGRNDARLLAAVAQLAQEGLSVSGSCFDVANVQAVQEAIDAIEANGQAIGILVNNAGMQFRSPLENFPVEQWDKLLQLNVSSIFYASKAVAKHMLARGKGKIVNIASVQSELARPGIAPYAASKGAVRNLTRGMATDWARKGLQVNGIAPGYFRTEMTEQLVNDADFSAWLAQRTPAGRWGDVHELVGAAVFLSSDASSFVNGQLIYVDGGMTISV